MALEWQNPCSADPERAAALLVWPAPKMWNKADLNTGNLRCKRDWEHTELKITSGFQSDAKLCSPGDYNECSCASVFPATHWASITFLSQALALTDAQHAAGLRTMLVPISETEPSGVPAFSYYKNLQFLILLYIFHSYSPYSSIYFSQKTKF